MLVVEGLLAFDLGTSGVKCVLVDKRGAELGSRYGEYATYYPAPNFREQCPKHWIGRIVEAAAALREEFPDIDICGIGVSGHSLGAIPVDREGNLLAQRVPIWSDARAVLHAERFFKQVEYRQWYEITGNGFPRELYALFKIMWYKENEPELYNRTEKFIGSKDYVNLFLTGKAVTDISYASGSGLLDLKKCVYREDYARAAGIDIRKMPQIYQSHEIIGYVTEAAAQKMNIPAGIPVVAGGVDNACMTLGAGCIQDGDAYPSLGSSAWITASVSEPVVDYDSRIYTFAHCVPGQYLPSVGIFASGSALSWAADKWFADYTGYDRFDKIGTLAAQSPLGANGLLFNPCLAGGSSFDKSPNIRGCLFNLSLGNTREDIARAVFEGIAMHLRLAAEALERTGRLGKRLLVVGGGAKGDFNRRIYADVFGKEIAVSQVQQGAASLGAAALAAVGCGMWDSFEPLRELHRNVTTSAPNWDNHAWYDKIMPLYVRFCDACSDLGDLVEQ